MIKKFFATISFLTILPINNKLKPTYKLFPFFPLVGLILGLLCGYWFKFLKIFFDNKISIFFSLVIYIVLSDILHLDGFVDTIDALFGNVKKNYEVIFKDPHIGVAGCIYLFLLLYMKYLLFVNLDSPSLAFLTTPVLSRWSMSVVGFYGNFVEWSNLGREFVYKDIKIFVFSLISVTVCMFVVFKNLLIIPILLFSTFFVSLVLTKLFNYKFGGINGDIFGFISETIEVLVLLTFNFWR